MNNVTKTLAVWKILKTEAIKKYQTQGNKFSDFPVGTHVKIITPVCDFTFFYGETGIVTANEERYLGVEVRYDIPRKYADGTLHTCFNFNPIDLLALPVEEKAIDEEPENLYLKRYYKWLDNEDVIYNDTNGDTYWIAAFNEVRQIIRDQIDDSRSGGANIEEFDMHQLDQILQEEIEGNNDSTN